MNTPVQRPRLVLAALALAVAAATVLLTPAAAYRVTSHNRANVLEQLRDDGRLGVLVTAL